MTNQSRPLATRIVLFRGPSPTVVPAGDTVLWPAGTAVTRIINTETGADLILGHAEAAGPGGHLFDSAGVCVACGSRTCDDPEACPGPAREGQGNLASVPRVDVGANMLEMTQRELASAERELKVMIVDRDAWRQRAIDYRNAIDMALEQFEKGEKALARKTLRAASGEEKNGEAG